VSSPNVCITVLFKVDAFLRFISTIAALLTWQSFYCAAAPAAEKKCIPQQSQTHALRPESVKSQPTGEDASTVRPPSSTTNVSLRTKHIEASHKPDQETREIRTSSEGSHDGHDLEKGDATGEQVVATPIDPNIVDFDGPDDPEMAINWTKKQKWSTVGILSLLTFIT
jgi:hypothetical protein